MDDPGRVTPNVEVLVVRAGGCHLCDDALEALAELAGDFPLAVREVAADSPEGAAVMRDHRPPMLPVVLLDGAVFSWGRLPRKKLRRALASAQPEAGTT
ncbi:MAG: glutaredoxin family protein [Actinobacteria bacterium]|nr:glutaredoxin family protein [Actinomycetota bacterium]